ncbi:MAG: MBL fold metallo-hydrolase [Firmicutes bacterium]|nr:MBL fold metallo-hydrolase [Bacillota bacterium]
MERITDNVFTATDYRGCNPTYVSTKDGVVVIDPPQLVTKILEMKKEIEPKGPVRFLINTEKHIDHIFGNHWFAGMCPVIAHEAIIPGFWVSPMYPDLYEYSLDVIQRQDPEGRSFMPTKEQYIVNRPTVTFSQRMTLRVGDHAIELLHTPGHTKEQIAVYIPRERVVIVGDTIFSHCQTWLQEADPLAWLKTLEFLNTLDVDYIIPGHGPVVKKEYLPVQGAFICEWVTAVAVGIAKGWSKEECMERISFLDRCPVDIGQESSGPMVQQLNVKRLYDYLQGKAERFKWSLDN